MNEIVLKYNKSEYQSKINQLDALLTQLNSHLSNLQTYQTQLKEFWNDEEAAKYSSLLTTQIIAVKNAIENTTKLRNEFADIVSDVGQKQSIVNTILGDASGLLKALNVSEGGESSGSSTAAPSNGK